MSIRKDIPELIEAGIISKATAKEIEDFYKSKSDTSPNRLLIVFGILGAILVGLGIILMIAHNWDELSRITKTVFAFLPLVGAQTICGLVFLKKLNNTVWREGSSTFLFIAVGACISLISQIYNIPGNLGSFILIWMLLSFPLTYVMKSSMAAILYVIGVTYYATEIGYFDHPTTPPYLYPLLLLGILPHYYFLYKNNPKSNFLIFQNWLIPLSLTIVLGSFTTTYSQFIFIAYFSLFGLFYTIGDRDFFKNQKLRNNAYKVLGGLGSLTLLFIASFNGFWREIHSSGFEFQEILRTPEFYAAIVFTLLAIGNLYIQKKEKPLKQIPAISFLFILYIICFGIGLFTSISMILINLIILALSILTILKGAKQEHFGILNFGLSIITVLIIFRFLDNDFSFVIRGLLLVLIGIGFFIANYWILKKRKGDE